YRGDESVGRRLSPGDETGQQETGHGPAHYEPSPSPQYGEVVDQLRLALFHRRDPRPRSSRTSPGLAREVAPPGPPSGLRVAGKPTLSHPRTGMRPSAAFCRTMLLDRAPEPVRQKRGRRSPCRDPSARPSPPLRGGDACSSPRELALPVKARGDSGFTSTV